MRARPPSAIRLSPMSKALMRRVDPAVVWTAALIASLLPLLAAVDPILRYVHVLAPNNPWAQWSLSPGITVPTLAVVALYIAGNRDTAPGVRDPHPEFRHLAFFGGVAAVFLALQSPIEQISDHSFAVHAVEHMLLRTVGPMLLMLAAPQAALLRGLPGFLRRRVVAPLLSSSPVRALGILGHPAVATLLFIGASDFWMIPHFHDLSLLDEPIHYLWHTTLLLTGLIFFWRLLDPRSHPYGAALGTRLLMFWFAAINDILLGYFLTFKHEVLYHAYDQFGRYWGVAPLTDESLGGLTMWVPGCMMLSIAALLVIYRWTRQEERRAARARGAAVTITADEFILRRRAANRKTAVVLLAFAATVLMIATMSALLNRYSGAAVGIAAMLNR